MRIKLTCILLVLVFLLGMLGAAVPQNEPSRNEHGSLKILSIGNSFNQDVMAYLPPVLNEILPNTKLTYGILETSSASLEQQLKWFEDGTKYRIFDYWSPGAKAWKRYSGDKSKSLSEALALLDWDIIAFQGVSTDVLSDDSIKKMTQDAERLIAQLRARAQKPFVAMWFEWIGRPEGYLSSNQMAEKIRNATLHVFSELDIDAVIPVGDAFQAARKDEKLRKIGSRPNGELLYKDNIHMQAGLPALLASYTTAAEILWHYGINVTKLENSQWLPTFANAREINATNANGDTFTHGYPDDVTTANSKLAKQIAIDSVIGFEDDLPSKYSSDTKNMRYALHTTATPSNSRMCIR